MVDAHANRIADGRMDLIEQIPGDVAPDVAVLHIEHRDEARKLPILQCRLAIGNEISFSGGSAGPTCSKLMTPAARRAPV